ncbi:MAG: phenylacetate--CoA ligase family protein [Bacteroidales bacterium]|nr:phenylacetate--CoA ligase family protein [Bacteroidales bacterium]
MSLYSYIDGHILLPLGDRLKGRDLHGAFAEALRTEWFTEEQLEQLQNEKLQHLVRHCYENVPWYRKVFDERHLTPDDIRTRADLVKLPILTKQTVREHREEFISRDAAQRKYVEDSTGGSTGTPMRYLEDMGTWNTRRGLGRRGWAWAGFEVGEKLFTLAGNSLVRKNADGKKVLLKDLYDRIIMRNCKQDCTDVTPEALERYYRAMMRYKPSGIRGYASSLYFLARYIEQHRLPVCPVKVVLTSGEKLHPAYRYKLQQVFRAPVFDAYGAADGGVSAHECYMHEGLHIGEEHCILEIVDTAGNPLPEGEVGHVITTDLNNYAFPFLRYRVGDMAYIKPERCSCGRAHRLLGEVIGREGRAIYNKQGRPYSSIVMDNMMFKDLDFHTEAHQRLYEKMERFQIRQDSRGDLKILIKPADPAEPLETFAYIRENFQQYFPDSAVELLFVEDIPPLPSGKEDYCYSEFVY